MSSERLLSLKMWSKLVFCCHLFLFFHAVVLDPESLHQSARALHPLWPIRVKFSRATYCPRVWHQLSKSAVRFTWQDQDLSNLAEIQVQPRLAWVSCIKKNCDPSENKITWFFELEVIISRSSLTDASRVTPRPPVLFINFFNSKQVHETTAYFNGHRPCSVLCHPVTSRD